MFENKRIFISDLPETLTKEELTSKFSQYGQVSSVEIKERKVLGPNKYNFFAYVNVITDDSTLQKCFQDVSRKKWHGEYIQPQLARESFLERLKRERQEAQEKQKNEDPPIKNQYLKIQPIDAPKPKKTKTISLCSPELQKHTPNGVKSPQISDNESKKSKESLEIPQQINDSEKIEGFVIKSNKNKVLSKEGLKIPSVGSSVIAEHTKTKNKKGKNDSEANLKRLQALRDMKKEYAARKSIIKNALSYGSKKPTNNRIVFDEDGNELANVHKNKDTNGFMSQSKRTALFDEENSEEDSDFEVNLEVKEQFQGKSGQKLLELQSKFRNDRRFALDQRFLDEEIEEEKASDVEENLEKEKNDNLRIVEQIIGKKVATAPKRDNDTFRPMIRYDPLLPEHQNLKPTTKKTQKLREEKPQEPEKSKPEVSKEVFYKIAGNFKEKLEENQEFSLLSMFGRSEESEDNNKKVKDGSAKELKRSVLASSRNPFKYDSSDEEDETEDIPHKDNSQGQPKNVEAVPARPSQWFYHESFFFKKDDPRLQEGHDFLMRLKTQKKQEDFQKTRVELKKIVKAKLRNNERKNKMFNKKLGGSKRKKMIRIKKAMKR